MPLHTSITFLRDGDGILLKKPRIITRKDANCTGFAVTQDNDRNFPVLRVWREMTDAQCKRDLYNEDGRPPTLLFSISCPTLIMSRLGMEVVGFEETNLCFAGRMIEAYKEKQRPLARASDANDHRYAHDRAVNLYPQHIFLE